MPRALKVFRYSDGFHAWTVAASSRAKALAAWGMTRDLFRDGMAEEIRAGPDHAAALAAPGELIKRGLSVDVGKVERTKAPKKKAGAGAKDRARVAALEAELAGLDAAQGEETAALDARREALDREAEDLAKRQDRDREAVKAKLKAARARLS
ncbi:hypothetical protein [Brevundimonas sp.]|uniref:hypothetical protein n=1 Tax=Brevundimonas sp. TaxID=1871086 RepID=UPI00120C3626|nr:hypothetical protein [Brevundimonas sp.]TAJ55899.1 MAG: hypothetical protein EPO49_15285 [Brevundimonas sp.]